MHYKAFHIRAATIEDSTLLSAWWNDGRIMAHAGFHYGTGETPRQIAQQLLEDQNGPHHRYILEYKEIPIGEMNYRDLDGHTAEIGIKICNETYQDMGLGRVFLSIMLEYLFDQQGFTRIVLDTNLKNHRARHTYERLGFRQQRIRSDAFRDDTGLWQTAVDYALEPCDFVNFAV